MTRFALSIALIAAATFASAADPTPLAVLAQFKESRKQLRSGQFVMTGKEVRPEPGRPIVVDPFRVESWFDADAKAARFDCEITISAWDPQKKQYEVIESTGKYVRRNDLSIEWLDKPLQGTTRLATFRKAGAKVNSAHIRPFDPRTAGLGYTRSYHICDDYNELVAFLESEIRSGKVTASRIAPAVVRLEITSEHAKRRYDFDESKGTVPVAHEVKVNANVRGLSGEWGTTEWTQVNGVWVPQKVTANGGQRGVRSHEIQATFDWKSVNRPIAPELFKVRGMGLPKTTQIIERDGDKVVELGKVGDAVPHPRIAELESPTR